MVVWKHHDSYVLMEGQILKVLVGSRAHGLATPESDHDYRGVFVAPTREILKLGGHAKRTSWVEGKDDDTSWELGHFLFLATKSNPTILETFLAPTVGETHRLGLLLRDLFPLVWSSRGVRDAFVGYGLNQRKKFLEAKDGRPHKYAAAYLRTLFNAWELLRTGTFTVRIADTEIGPTVRRFKEGDYTVGEVVQTCHDWQWIVEEAYQRNPGKTTDHELMNHFLIKIRRECWDGLPD